MRRIPPTTILCVVAVLNQACAGPVVTPAVDASAYEVLPALRDLMDAVTFHHGFDQESLLPDMAVGEWEPQKLGEPKLAAGLVGKALVAGTGSLLFKDTRNWTLTTRGALCLWVSPVEWNQEEAGNTNFVLSHSSAFYVERQGPLRKPDGAWARLESLLVGLQRGPKGSAYAGCAGWKPGEWHLIAVNWSWPQLALSVDGGAFNATELPGKPDPDLFGGLILGSNGGDPTLLDEFFCFNRPLSAAEVKALHQAMRPKAASEGE
ncbi:MAG: hypothetical protein COZ06_09085 [Armatimonadetes bacterium CG_4_10_14_3_um_filter_66_18]|nr:LamG domain-containing protein [Armatimonadota bacterium]PIU94030.1 MAG: hypothetical protein COS65_09750 [Armatimonadetes bacterium CG06_land_8_20_14_3_00_66_21]PIY50488.1 MAG: hypothetical protein COZ06_09085 [Armatimonadetes bacterium CG_4_10_14_3_um_filter_66_18]PIZ51493.1 MAG: hypothetical protein COY42_00140 [Armatimonadetes bacterium CG_4_10_14_0_8_um_filter_66_14]PJB62517.1 MAG: hypothetical protein CO096_25225 [Armatimonadetes bacterium CG_4_9_14_3_um_filter_66_14]